MSTTTTTTSPPARSTRYMRTVFTVYWQDASPSAEIFYFAGPMRMNPTDLTTMEQYVLSLMQEWYSTRADVATFISHCEVFMSPDEVTAAGWRVLGPPAIPLPGPDPTNNGSQPGPVV
jgi:hypothetical protein